MKHIQLLILCLGLLLIASDVQAQRTTSTIIADALAQLPADTPDKYNRVMTDLVSTGGAGLLDLIGRMNPPGNRSNEVLDYAISGWTHSVANDNAARKIAGDAYGKALQQPLDRDVKAFVIRQLHFIATDDNVEALSALLSDDYLSAPAAQALASIGTEKAGNALLAALESIGSTALRMNLVNAIGQTGALQAEAALLGLLGTKPSEAMQKVLFNALASTGTKKSLMVLRGAAKKSGYGYTRSNATATYVALLERLNNIESKLVKKEAEKLLAIGKKSGKQDIRVAATGLLLSQSSTKKEDILKEAIKDGDPVYLSGVLNLYQFENNKKVTVLLQEELTSAKLPEVQAALIYWVGKHDVKTAIPQIARLVGSSSAMIQKAAMLSLAQLGGEESLVVLASLLESDNEETVSLVKDALSTYNGDISHTLASVFTGSGEAGKKAILELVSIRKMESLYNLVHDQMSGDNPAVRSAAANTLKDVVTDSNLEDMFALLEWADATEVSAIQQAINAALDYLPAAKQLPLVTERMNNSQKKHLYYTALANGGSREAMNIINEAYASTAGIEKEAAFNALAQWKSLQGILPLLDIARNSKDNREQERMIGALIGVIRRSGQAVEVGYPHLTEAIQFAQTDRQKNDILQLIGNTGQYRALLFLEPYMDEPALKETAAQAAMNIAINNPSFAGKETSRILEKVSRALSNPDAGYQRQSITRYLAENSAVSTEPFKLSTEEKREGFRILFDGSSLDQWTGNKRDYVVEQGNIVLYPSVGTGGTLFTQEQFDNFVFRFEFMLTPAANNGLGIRAPMREDVSSSGIELQILDNEAPVYEKLAPYQYHGSVYGVIPAKRGFLKPVGEWNYQEVVAEGDHIKIVLNGTTILDGNIREASKNGTMDKRKHPGLLNETGHIGFLGHGSKVKFRNIRIKELK